MSASYLLKLLYGKGEPCDTKFCEGTAQTDGYGQVLNGLCLDCQMDAAYDAKAEADDSVTFGCEEYLANESAKNRRFMRRHAAQTKRLTLGCEEYLANESAKNRRFMRRHQTKRSEQRKLLILERQLGDHEYFTHHVNTARQKDHEPWKERSRHLVQRNRSIRQVLMRTWADDHDRHNWVCGGFGEHKCKTPNALLLGGSWQRFAPRSKWYRDPVSRQSTVRHAIREAMDDYLDQSWERPVLRSRKEPRLGQKELEAHRHELLPPDPQIGQYYSFSEWFDTYTVLDRRSRKLHRLERCRPCQGFTVDYRRHHCGPIGAYVTVSDPDYFQLVRPALYWPLKRWLARRDWRYSRMIRVNGSVTWNGPRLTYLNSAPKQPYKDAPAIKKGRANWSHYIQLA